MFHAGDQIENPVTGERLVFHETAAETNGERVVFETWAGGGAIPVDVEPAEQPTEPARPRALDG